MADRRAKLSYAVALAVEEIIRTSKAPTFFTFTFAENVTDKAEAARRYRRLKERIKRRHPTVRWVGVWQRQRRGAWHFHAVVDRRMDVVWLRMAGKDCGFGAQLVARAIGEAPGFHQGWSGKRVANYVCRYITRDMVGEEESGLRVVDYCGDCRRATIAFRWANGLGRLWRLGRAAWSEMFSQDEGQPGPDSFWFLVRLGWETLTADEQGQALRESDGISRWWDPERYPF